MTNPFKVILRGVGQVMLQNNAFTGLLFLVGIFYNSWLMGLGALLGSAVSTLTAVMLEYNEEDIKNGLYGFNGTLVGVALYFYFGLSITATVAIIIGAIISTVVMMAMKKRWPAFTAPFVISTWLIILVIKFFKLIPLLVLAGASNVLSLPSVVSMGFGQVMFQGNIVTGIIFFVAILVNSRKAAIYGLYGSLLGGLFALLMPFPAAMINIGLFGYNAVLCGIALGEEKRRRFLLATLAIILSVLINYGLVKIGIITLTAPFALATWAVLIGNKLFLKNQHAE